MSAADGAAKAADGEEKPRTRVSETRCFGLVTEWRGYMGWIQPLTKVEHEQATLHKGRIYLNQKDVLKAAAGRRIKEGSVVDFYMYTDHDGLGAEDAQLLTPLRMTLKHSEVNKLKLKPAWSDFLANSEYYPDFADDHKVLLRKYTWALPFALLEIWGTDDEILSKAAVHLATASKPDDEECELRLLLPEGAIAKVKDLTDAKLSETAVVTTPARCRNLTITGSRKKCMETTAAFMVATAPAIAAA